MGGTPALGARRAASGVLLARNSSGAWTGLVVFARAAERALEPGRAGGPWSVVPRRPLW